MAAKEDSRSPRSRLHSQKGLSSQGRYRIFPGELRNNVNADSCILIKAETAGNGSCTGPPYKTTSAVRLKFGGGILRICKDLTMTAKPGQIGMLFSIRMRYNELKETTP
jgi:hypothetical protein